ncbi:MAG TPA: hypothetical protein VN493_16630 [Thermoanaerobaculia bacterium]|nr:hypothetical protein [Thermoanaerobaculia bacterium]
MSDTEVRNKETLLGTVKNTDGSPVQEVVQDGEVVQEIQNKETLLGTVKNTDGTPVKEVVSKD